MLKLPRKLLYFWSFEPLLRSRNRLSLSYLLCYTFNPQIDFILWDSWWLPSSAWWGTFCPFLAGLFNKKTISQNFLLRISSYALPAIIAMSFAWAASPYVYQASSYNISSHTSSPIQRSSSVTALLRPKFTEATLPLSRRRATTTPRKPAKDDRVKGIHQKLRMCAEDEDALQQSESNLVGNSWIILERCQTLWDHFIEYIISSHTQLIMAIFHHAKWCYYKTHPTFTLFRLSRGKCRFSFLISNHWGLKMVFSVVFLY